MNSKFETLLLLSLCGTAIASGCSSVAGAPTLKNSDWNAVWQAAQAGSLQMAEDGPPVRDRDRVLFRFRAPADTAKVYLAGSFNAWAENNNGVVSNQRFAMTSAGHDLWYKRVTLEPKVHQYKYVVVSNNGESKWIADPHVQAVDKDGNTVLDFSTIAHLDSARPFSNRASLRVLKPFQPGAATPTAASKTLDVRADQVWVRPDQANALLVSLGEEGAGASLNVRVLTPFGTSVQEASVAAQKGDNRVPISALKHEGGYLVQVTLSKAGRTLAHGEVVLSVVQNVADDLRYGFYATYKDPQETNADYDAKAAMLAKLHVNAVEFYDYFPAHGYYAPREASYKFEPFGIPLNARDVQRKIEAGHRRNILSLAYVAAYAASESVYRQHPDPMTDKDGAPRIFNGSVMAEAEADRQKKEKWFWLMDVSAGSPWHKYILDEFGRTLDDSPNDLVSFDGFEMDTYGHGSDEKFYAKGSQRNGDLLSDVLHDFVGDVQSLTHKIKPHGLVSFNNVNEFGVARIYDVTDFLFLEIWSGHTENLEALVEICFRHHAPRSQRVILKLYPADMRPGQKSWPEATLRRLLGATMTGAGSLMVVGEPDAESDKMHALNTLYYPDHQPLTAANEQLLRDYYRFDALMVGWTHGKDVVNTPLDNAIPGCITRTYAAPSKKALVVQMLNVEGGPKWTVDTPAPAPRQNLEVTLDLPGGIAPNSVLFASPDVPALQTPVKLDFEVQGGKLRTALPELRGYGTLILRY